ncbi:VWA domain-containing protein [candidate division KSB1 bacterium]|nr:VWA domain-containing protein [candidate division KSB1 bacterium]
MNKIRRSGCFATLLLSCMFGADAFSQGFIVSDATPNGNLNLLRNKTKVSVTNQVAEFDVEQTFFNPAGDSKKASYYFPLSQGEVSGFSVKSGGAVFEGRLLPPDESFQVLQERVRSTGDPSWLALVDKRLFEVKLAPFSSHEKRTLTFMFVEVLERTGSLTSMTFPLPGNHLRHGHDSQITTTAEPPLYAFNKMRDAASYNGRTAPVEVDVALNTDSALINIYSPSHAINVKRKRSNRATISYSGENSFGHDFVLLFGTETGIVSADFVSYPPESGQDGYFMLTLSPTANLPASRIVSKDILFLVDVSGSMKGEKLKQVKSALKYAIGSLKDEDCFNIITFNTQLRLFGKDLVRAVDHGDEALDFINGIEARGGANLNEALLTALNVKGGHAKASTIFLITDGLPTVGVTDIAEIRTNAHRLNTRGYKIFNFGLGQDVHVDLLDGIAYDSKGLSIYVERASDISAAITEMFDRVKDPVLMDPKVDFGDMAVYDIYPETIPDLHKGKQVRIVGRYRNRGTARVRVSGELSTGKTEFAFPVSTADRVLHHAFVSRVWGVRKYGFLLEQQRFESPTDDLDAEISQLAGQYGMPPRKLPTAQIGKEAVMTSVFRSHFRLSDTPDLGHRRGIRHALGKTFIHDDSGIWVDTAQDATERTLKLMFGSQAYFDFAQNFTAAACYLAVGKKVTFKFRNTTVQVDDSGQQTMSKDEFEEIFARIL